MINKIIQITLVVLTVIGLAIAYVIDSIENFKAHSFVAKSEEIKARWRRASESDLARKRGACQAIQERFRSFSIKENRMVWDCLDRLRAEVETQEGIIGELEKTLVDFGRDPEADVDLLHIRGLQKELVNDMIAVSNRLVDAYLASVRHSIMPNSIEFTKLRDRAMRDGLLTAERINRKLDDKLEGKR